jgi:hypothetical protein
VVGSFASGSDVARELASVQIPTADLPESMQLARKRNHLSHPDVPAEGKVEVFQSSSMLPNDMSPYGKKEEKGQPWTRFIQHRPLIEKIEGGVIHFKDGSTLEDIDVIIFATGFYYQLPFAKSEDAPWNEKRVCEETVGDVDVLDEVNGWEKGGIQGLAIKELDEIKLFLKGDRTCALIALREYHLGSWTCPFQRHLNAASLPCYVAISSSLLGCTVPASRDSVALNSAVLGRPLTEHPRLVLRAIKGRRACAIGRQDETASTI